jgi:hypothetical protein
MNREQIIKHFTDNIAEYKKYAKNIAGRDDFEDLFSEVTLMLLEFPEERLIGYWNSNEGLKPVFLQMLKLQYNSKTSKYHKEYRKLNQFLQDKGLDVAYNMEETIDANEDDVEINPDITKKARQYAYVALGELFPCEEKESVFDLYVQTGSLRKTLAAIPEEKAKLFDLKKVHEIVRSYRKAIKLNINKLQAA